MYDATHQLLAPRNFPSVPAQVTQPTARLPRFRRFARVYAKPLVASFVAVLLVAAFFVWRVTRPKSEREFQIVVTVPAPGDELRFALYQSLGVRALSGHRVELLQNGAIFDVLSRDIAQARHSVHVLMYIWEKGSASDRLSAALMERARAGVQCRILVDDFGSPDFERDVQPALAHAGCEVRIFRPVPAHPVAYRNHRKVVVIDGAVALTGGFGVRDDWLGDGVHGDAWRDTNVRFSGPTVGDAQLAFAENWQEAGGALLPREAFPEFTAGSSAVPAEPAPDATWAAFVASTGSATLTRAERLTQLLIASARNSIWIENAYFVPSAAVVELLARQAQRGVDVRLLVPGKKSDSKTSFGAQQVEFGDMIERGIRIFEYQPTMLHAKTMVVDRVLSQIGSINLDPLSLRKLEEDALVVHDPAIAQALSAAFELDCQHALEQH